MIPLFISKYSPFCQANAERQSIECEVLNNLLQNPALTELYLEVSSFPLGIPCTHSSSTPPWEKDIYLTAAMELSLGLADSLSFSYLTHLEFAVFISIFTSENFLNRKLFNSGSKIFGQQHAQYILWRYSKKRNFKKCKIISKPASVLIINLWRNDGTICRANFGVGLPFLAAHSAFPPCVKFASLMKQITEGTGRKDCRSLIKRSRSMNCKLLTCWSNKPENLGNSE